MGIARLSPQEVAAAAVETLGLDSSIADLTTPEVLAAAVRRAASFSCPVSPRLLTVAVEESLRGLDLEDPPSADSGTRVRAMVESLVAYGDLVEAPVNDEARTAIHRTLFLAQPAYVRVSPTTCLVIGVAADGLSLMDDALADRIDRDAHVRRLVLQPHEDPSLVLGSVGLREVSEEHWLRRPPTCQPDALVADYDLRLRIAGPSGSIDGCRILDTSLPVTYYRGRWRSPTKRDTGSYVARRPLEYGADAWCYAELRDGEVVTVVDLPLRQGLDRACDEAWRLQAALDHAAGNPQAVWVARTASPGRAILHVLSPIPSWAQRRLDAVGQPLPKQRGSLIAYSVERGQLEEEISFLEQTMWITLDEHRPR